MEITATGTVPYCSQFGSPELVPELISGTLAAQDDPRWAESGASTPQEYAWWCRRVCGMACLRMALLHWRGSAPGTVELAHQCVAAGGYVVDGERVEGLIYAPFARYAGERWGLAATVETSLDPAGIRAHLDAGRLPMLSVHPSIRTLNPEPPFRGGHLVLAVDHDDEALYVNNPSGYPGSQHYARVPWADLDRFFARRGVVLGADADVRPGG
ncbi:C39 family peptidase [Streptacidiphilus jiangxiensis]|uniref:Peptidase_C39 like family protein n=1 Tax=Streptacidiphilus jiangxiensis TaxID=235985 RepID=A0A1H7TQJ2_STRJI|nr:C39 family peptidase [Streptacidiphilus jiangxiensis]SEL86636.1 Peptidase_C39 like family protein [Streptacidiphilus jiangxiensis]